VHIQFGRCPLKAVWDGALASLVRNKEIIKQLNFIDLVLPELDESYQDALSRFERGEVNKVVFKPNGMDA
jgi:hypothetical protein